MNLQAHGFDRIAVIRTQAFRVGLVLSLVCAAGPFVAPAQFYPAYLVAFLFFWSIAMGCLALSCLHHITGGGWGVAIRRVVEAGAGTLPLLALLYIPLLCGLPTLYLWARPMAVASDARLQLKAAYLNVRFFEFRACVYFVVWILLATILNRMSVHDRLQPSNQRREKLALIGALGLIAWGLTVTFASIDWAMSLEPHWVSGIHGVIYMAGQSVAGTAFAIATIVLLRDYGPIARVLNESRFHDLGNFLLALVLFWAYTSFTQYLVIWSGNLPEETPWYLIRGRGGWQIVMLLLVGGHFVVPVVLLLNRSVKRNLYQLATVALLVMVMRAVDLYWQVMPTFSPGGFQFNWFVLITFPAIGGLWLWNFARMLPALASVAVEEPHSEETPHHAHI